MTRLPRHPALFALALAACTTSSSDDGGSSDTTGTSTTGGPDPSSDMSWSIDDDQREGMFASLNCEFDGTNLRLSATDTGGLGTIQIVMAGIPTASGAFAVSSDLGSLADAQIYISIGLDRESENQYVAQSGSVDVSVVTTDPQEINLVFADLPGTTSAGANGALSGNVGARDGAFVGACDFDGL